MWTLRLVALLSCLIGALADIEAYNDRTFEKMTVTGKHFIQFWRIGCHDSIGMIDTLLAIDTALGNGEEDIWIGRIDYYPNKGLVQRFGITTTPMFVYIVGDKYYKVDPNRSFVTEDIVEYLRSGFLSDVAYDIPPAPVIPRETKGFVLPRWFTKVVDDVFGEPDVVFTERKSVTTLRRALTVLLVAIVALKAILGGIRATNKEKTE
ncbi:hypothetical protein MHU86_12472 [Fragilaria crotonensis]|nr:hypothetical protein MHU86_12472 [Fragilaria crotonensis]